MIMSTGSIEASPSPSPGSFPTTITLHNSFPKMGTLIPNRVFVGGISTSTTESELHQLFSEFGNVKQTKIIADRSGVSKGYGFVTFETEEEARRLQAASEDIVLKERKLNIAPAIKKQPNYTTGAGRGYEMGQPIVNGAVYYHNGIPYTYQNGVAMFITGDPNALNGLLSPTGQKGLASSPYPVLYPGAGSTMFIPTAAQPGPTTPLPLLLSEIWLRVLLVVVEARYRANRHLPILVGGLQALLQQVLEEPLLEPQLQPHTH